MMMFLGVFVIIVSVGDAFTHQSSFLHSSSILSSSIVAPTSTELGPGGWSGSGKPEKRLNDEEFANPANRGDTEAKSGKKKRRRRTSSNFQQDLGVSNSLGQVYDLQDSSTFAQRVSQERNEIQDSRMADLMRIAEIAGIKREPKANEGERSDESNQKLGKFEDDIFGDDIFGDDIFGDDDDTLDVRVY